MTRLLTITCGKHRNRLAAEPQRAQTHFTGILPLLRGEAGAMDNPEVPHESRLARLAGAEEKDFVIASHLPLVSPDLTLDLGVDSPDLLDHRLIFLTRIKLYIKSTKIILGCD